MPKPYSIDLRKKIVAAYYENQESSIRKLVKRFKVSKSFIFGLLKRVKQTGQVAPKPHGGGRRPSIDKFGQTFIKELLESQPDLTLKEITNEYNQRFDSVGKSTIDRTLTKLKPFLQKKTLFDPRKNTPENQNSLQNYGN